MVSWRLVCLTSLVLSDQSLALGSREGGAALQRLDTEERGDLPMRRKSCPIKEFGPGAEQGVTCTRVWSGHHKCERKAAPRRPSPRREKEES